MQEITEVHASPIWPLRHRDWGITRIRVMIHLGLFLLTLFSIFFFGVVFSSFSPGTPLLRQFSDPRVLSSGLSYSLTLVSILLAHELGHYIACRYYGVRATLPYFLPAPTPPIGTFGAFIRIKDPITSRKALFDIGIAGPLAGFALALPTALIGMIYADPAPPSPLVHGVITFKDPLLYILMQKLFGFPAMVYWNPIYFAAWVGMLATSLNLLPIGQLDGGHVVYALLGRRGHRLVARGIFVLVCVLAVVAYSKYRWPGWFIYVALLAFLLGFKHPPVDDESEPIGKERVVIGLVGLLVFVLTFMPFPIAMS